MPKPEGVFPDSVGKYKLKTVDDGRKASYQNEKDLKKEFSSWLSVYENEAKKIQFVADIHQTPEEASNEVKFLTECYDTSRKLQLYSKILEKIPLKDKSGKEVGTMAVCLRKKNTDSSESLNTFGNYDYTFGFSNDNRTYKVKSIPSDKAAELVEFIKSLPFNSQLDLSVLDQFSSSDSVKIKYEETFNTPPPIKLAAKPYLKGKVLVLEKKPTDDNEKTILISNSTESYITDPERQAILPGNIGSIVRIDCRKGNRIGDYSVDETTKVPAFGSICEVSVADNKMPAIIVKKTFSYNDLPDIAMMEKDKSGKLLKTQYIAAFPTDEIKKFLESLPKA